MLTAAPRIVAARPSFGGRVVNRPRPINTMDGYAAREGTERPKRSAEDHGPAGGAVLRDPGRARRRRQEADRRASGAGRGWPGSTGRVGR